MQNETELIDAQEQVERLKGTEVPANAQLPFELLHGKGKKTTKLVANSGSTEPMNGSNRWYEFEFSEPVFITEVVVDEENYNTFSEFEFRWKLVHGGDVNQKISKKGDHNYRAQINQLVRQVSFKPPSKWLTETKITRVQLIGFQVDELEDFVRLVAQLDSYKAEIVSETDKAIQNAQSANQEVAQAAIDLTKISSQISDAIAEVAELNANMGRLTEERKSLLEDIVTREETISKLDERRSKIQETIGERTTVRETLATEIVAQKQTLRALEDDVNMFPTEIGAFVSQGGQNIGTYWKLASVPIALLVIVTGLLVFNAANLTTVLDETEHANIWSIFVTRIPYVVIATAIITASYKLARMLVTEIMRINQQRLNLSKISIVATDASNTSQEGLSDLSDRELYELRTDLKMQLLRDHLKDYLSSDFRYQGKSTSNWTRMLEKGDQEPDEALGDQTRTEE